MIDLRFRPLDRWLGQKTLASQRKRPHFTITYPRILDSLERELRHLNAKNATVEAGFREDQIRNDGWPYGNATPAEPGIILSFDSKYGPLALPCDHFTYWHGNLRAIGLHLENLRLASAYGVGERGEQYKGWKQIAGPGGANSLREFADRLLKIACMTHTYQPEQVLDRYETFRYVYRSAAALVHPDKVGDTIQWNLVQEAEHIIQQYYDGRAELARA